MPLCEWSRESGYETLHVYCLATLYLLSQVRKEEAMFVAVKLSDMYGSYALPPVRPAQTLDEATSEKNFRGQAVRGKQSPTHKAVWRSLHMQPPFTIHAPLPAYIPPPNSPHPVSVSPQCLTTGA